jgi:hypothetical protein
MRTPAPTFGSEARRSIHLKVGQDAGRSVSRFALNLDAAVGLVGGRLPTPSCSKG